MLPLGENMSLGCEGTQGPADLAKDERQYSHDLIAIDIPC